MPEAWREDIYGPIKEKITTFNDISQEEIVLYLEGEGIESMPEEKPLVTIERDRQQQFKNYLSRTTVPGEWKKAFYDQVHETINGLRDRETIRTELAKFGIPMSPAFDLATALAQERSNKYWFDKVLKKDAKGKVIGIKREVCGRLARKLNIFY